MARLILIKFGGSTILSLSNVLEKIAPPSDLCIVAEQSPKLVPHTRH